MITIPLHVRNRLLEHSNVLPENMPFKLLNTSDHNIYLWFIDVKIGFIVEEDNWVERSMAEASRSDTNKTLPCTELPLDYLNITNARIYKDFSMSWYTKDELHTCTKLEAIEQLNEWRLSLIKKSNNYWLRLTGRASSYRKIAGALESFRIKISDLAQK